MLCVNEVTGLLINNTDMDTQQHGHIVNMHQCTVFIGNGKLVSVYRIFYSCYIHFRNWSNGPFIFE